MRQRSGMSESSCAARFEPLECRLLLSGFTAYNDAVTGPQTHPNTTLYADNGGDSSGPLKDVTTGAYVPVHLSTYAVGVHWGGTGSNPSAGTDAAEIFGGLVDFTSAVANNSVEISGGDSYTYLFSHLDTGSTYEFAGTAVRGNSDYTNRWTLVTLTGADSFTPAHSTGIGVVTEGLDANQVALWTGANHQSGQGFVAQWTEIDPGADGEFEVISTQYTGATPGVGSGVANGSKGYGLNGIRLIENVPSGPPAVINVPATNVRAFEAEIGGEITTTGGQAPDVSLYYGDEDGGTDAGAWDHRIDLGRQSGAFSEVVAGLAQNTTYHFRSFAENSLGSAWAPAAESFTTLTATAPSVANAGAMNIGAFSAWLGGEVTDTGNDPPIVTIYYGDNDGGTIPGDWDGSMDVGVQAAAFAGFVGGLEPETTYYFTAYAQNAVGGAWATPPLSFDTTETPPLQVSEFMADNADVLLTRTRGEAGDPFLGDYSSPDWIEVHNPTDAVAVLDGYHLTDDLAAPMRWTFPAGTAVEPGGFLVVFASGDDVVDPDLDENGCLHTNFKLSDDGGEDVALTDADGVVVFAYADYPVQNEDISYGVGGDGLERFFPAPTPGWDNANDVPRAPRFSIASTTFTGSISVELTASYPTDTVHYTLDESPPTGSSPVYSGLLTIAETTMVRAVAIGANGKSSLVISETYIELGADVLDDSSNLPLVIVETFGDGVPGTTSGFGDSFIAVFEPGADGRSRLTDPFAVAARSGIHIRGSTSATFPKKQYRVEFWDESDEDRKLGLLGMPAEADWILYGPSRYDRALINNPLAYDLSNQMGRYAVRTRWVEMYLNANGGEVTASDYVGAYAVMEVIERGDDRVDIEPLSSGAGGVPVDGGFAWKNDKSGKYVEPEDPTSAQRAFIDGYSNSLLSAATGPNFTDPELGYAAWADVDSFIDHNLINMLLMNVDALRISTYYYKMRDGELEAGPIWDFDRALDSTDSRDNNPLWWNGTGDSTLYFNDGSRVMLWWPSMFQDPDFVQKYIDRWFELRESVFSLENIHGTIDAHAAQLEEAAPRDYARWSAARYGGFAGEMQHMKDWLTDRIHWIDSQWLARPGLDVAGPVVTPGTQVTLSSPVGQVYYTLDGCDPRGFGGAASGSAIPASGPITIDAYTRITARVYQANHGPTSQGYVPSGDDWSPPVVAEYFVNPLVSPGDVVVSEINYHPFDPTPEELAAQPPEEPDFRDEDFEFIELVNVSGHTVNIRGVKLSDGVRFEFGSHVLGDGERIVVARNAEAFTARYGMDGSLEGTGITLAGAWTGGLDNGGEKVAALSRGGATVLDFTYNDAGNWPERADGKGSSLEIIDAGGDGGDPANWRSSVAYGGTPGAEPQAEVGVVINEVLTHTDWPEADAIELYNATDQAIDIAGWYLSDSWGWESSPANGNYKKFRIPVLDLGEAGKTLLGGGEYIVFDERDFNPSGGGDPNDFALSGAHGDDVWLMRADADGRLTAYSDHVEFGAAANGESFGRWPNGGSEPYPLIAPTLGGPNSHPRIGPVVISEVMYYPGMFHEDFNAGGAERFAEVLGEWLVADGRYRATPASVGCDAVATVNLSETLWPDYILEADINAAAAGGGYVSNAAVIFDYHGQTDFKFARLSADDGQWQIGRRDASGWVVHASVGDSMIEAGESYDLKLRVEASLATLLVDGEETLSHDFGEALHDGSLGIGAGNAAASFGMVAVEPVGESDLEFIELYNPTDEVVHLAEWRGNPHQAGQYLAGWRLGKGVDVEFAEGQAIGAKSTLVVLSFDPGDPENAARVAAFRSFYGIDESVPLAGAYCGKLSNGGERVQLQRPDEPPVDEPDFVPHLLEDEVDYDDESPWPTGADGNGRSLHRRSAGLWGNAPGSWEALAPTPGSFRLAAVTWSSAAEHADVGEVLLEVPDDGSFSEPRMAGVTRLVIEFSGAIDPMSLSPSWVLLAGNDANSQPVDLSSIVVSTSTRDGDTVGVIDFSPALPDVVRYLVQIEGVTDAAGDPLSGDNSRIFTALSGDTNSDFRVNAIDLSYIWPRRTTRIDGVTVEQTRSDVTGDGRINAIDLSATWPRRGPNMQNVLDPVLPGKTGGAGTSQGAMDAAAALWPATQEGTSPAADARTQPADPLSPPAPTADALLSAVSASPQPVDVLAAPVDARMEAAGPAPAASSLDVDLLDILAEDALAAPLGGDIGGADDRS